jgi:hypothetical protein
MRLQLNIYRQLQPVIKKSYNRAAFPCKASVLIILSIFVFSNGPILFKRKEITILI